MYKFEIAFFRKGPMKYFSDTFFMMPKTSKIIGLLTISLSNFLYPIAHSGMMWSITICQILESVRVFGGQEDC